MTLGCGAPNKGAQALYHVPVPRLECLTSDMVAMKGELDHDRGAVPESTASLSCFMDSDLIKRAMAANPTAVPGVVLRQFLGDLNRMSFRGRWVGECFLVHVLECGPVRNKEAKSFHGAPVLCRLGNGLGEGGNYRRHGAEYGGAQFSRARSLDGTLGAHIAMARRAVRAAQPVWDKAAGLQVKSGKREPQAKAGSRPRVRVGAAICATASSRTPIRGGRLFKIDHF
jgi:hypothetical protein